eukprot:gene8417-biopygen12139
MNGGGSIHPVTVAGCAGGRLRHQPYERVFFPGVHAVAGCTGRNGSGRVPHGTDASRTRPQPFLPGRGNLFTGLGESGGSRCGGQTRGTGQRTRAGRGPCDRIQRERTRTGRGPDAGSWWAPRERDFVGGGRLRLSQHLFGEVRPLQRGAATCAAQHR